MNVVPLETYVQRIVAGEVYGSWPEAVLKAQAVVARTYALHEREQRRQEAFDVESGVLDQAYAKGSVPEVVRASVFATRGEFLAFEGTPILAAYHASAGGRTASALEVWGQPFPYLQPVLSPDDRSPSYFWSFEISFKDLLAALRESQVETGPSPSIEIVSRSESGRVRILRVGEAELSGHELRQVLGGRAIESALFDVRVKGDTVRFLGSGSGHGVGLSQWGAREMARRGQSYRQILTHYYPGTRLRRLEADRAEAKP